MKLLKFTVIVCVMIFTFSCTEDELPIVQSDVTGQWRLTDLDYSGITVVDWDGETFESNFAGKGEDLDCLLKINESPKTFVAEGDYVVVLTYDFFGIEQEMPVPMEGFMSNGNWSRNGDQLTVETEGQDPATCTILELTGEKMVLAYAATISQSMDGVTNTSTLDGTYTFVRE
ncbi:hypothetical protein FKX85_12395 [Echinicola soli]|uniref:Lipocalin-like domain-containing protein n=1 Tax=Echinicola soli TaxID=2591634 RepID=A0A514CIZ2_9BACT|nr:lipocalin family protein [Echinicola soli]QDH79788.1 hypothetical protein FKX85_12395 [Echinicola soli]